MKPLHVLAWAFCFLFITVPEARAAADAAAIKTTVDTAAQAFRKANPQAAGISIGVIEDGQTFTFHYGTTELGQTKTPTDKTLYPIASITKTFTGTLLAQAAMEGKLKLDDDIRHYLEGDYPNLEFDGRPIHIADLVDHRSGLPFFIPDRPETQPVPGDTPWLTRIDTFEKTYSRADFYADLHKVKLAGKPGEIVQYSNAAAMLAGYILERIYGRSYEALVERKILQPLGMTATTFKPTPATMAKGYDGTGREMPGNSEVLAAAGGLKSDVTDMLKYAAWQLAESDPAVKLSHQHYAESGNYAAGLNWQMLTAPDKRVIWQTGNIEGFHSYCILEPELKLALVVMFNEGDDKSMPAHGVMVNQILQGLNPDAILLP